MSILSLPTARAFAPLVPPSRYKGAHGGRGSGKSHFFAELMVEENIAEKHDNVCLREIQKSLTYSVKKLIEQKIEGMNAGDYFDVQDKKIGTRRGGVIIFDGLQNHTAASIKSLEDFDRAWVEEAQDLSQRSLDILRPTLRRPGSQLWFGWNPNLPTDPIDVLLRGEKPPPDSVVVEVNYHDNPWFGETELQAEMEYDRGRDPEKYAHVWLGAYQTHAEARVFKNWRVAEFDVDENAIKRQGADWGYSIDPSVLIQCYIDGKTLYVPYEAYRVGCDIDDTPELFFTVPQAEKWPMTADSARPETIAYMKKNGFPKIGAAVKGPKSVEEGVAFLQSFDIVVHPRCVHLADELRLYRYKTDPLTGKVLPILEDKNNNCIDALRYACEGARRAKPQRQPVHEPDPPRSWMS